MNPRETDLHVRVLFARDLALLLAAGHTGEEAGAFSVLAEHLDATAELIEARLDEVRAAMEPTPSEKPLRKAVR